MRPEPGRRLFFEALALAEAGAELQLDKAARQHARVLRIKDGAPIELFDGQGRLASGALRGRSVMIDEVVERPAPKRRLGLLQGLPKGAKSDDIVRMATELGATDIVFVRTERSVAFAKDHDKKMQRWMRIAHEASRQCERLYFPDIRMHGALDEALAELPVDDTHYYAWARQANDEPGPARATCGANRWIAVGPEGGFSDDERSAFDAAGFCALSLGPHVLRVDTAACAALALVAQI